MRGRKALNALITFRITTEEKRRLEYILRKAQRKNGLIAMSHIIPELFGFWMLRKPVLSDDDRKYLTEVG